MRDKPTTDGPDQMPAHVDFANAVRGRHAIGHHGDLTVRVHNPDGTIDERRVEPGRRPDAAAFSPHSLTGVIDELLYYVYNPATDVITLRVVPSLSHSVVYTDEGNGYLTVSSEAGGQPVGLVIHDFGRRFLSAQQAGQPVSQADVERGLGLMRHVMRMAA